MINVKIVSRASKDTWLRQFPDHQPVWGNCRFILKAEEADFDWIVVYEDVLYPDETGRNKGIFTHQCNPHNTLLITQEPPNIKSYGRAFTKQFGWVLTSQPEWALLHPQRIYSQPALLWFYGAHKGLKYNEMAASYPTGKTKMLSTICSSKQQRHTLHHRRFNFTQMLKEYLPEMELFGKGVRPVHDKSEAIDDYKYHVVVENYIGLHHLTEKLPDAFLGASLPFYAGCTNAAEYYPEDSFIPINVHDPKGAAETIRKAIDNNEYEKRLPAILEARRLALDKYSTFAVLSREIEARRSNTPKPEKPQTLLSRKELRKRPDVAIVDLYDKARLRLRYSFQG